MFAIRMPHPLKGYQKAHGSQMIALYTTRRIAERYNKYGGTVVEVDIVEEPRGN